jgi:hypothetical protein
MFMIRKVGLFLLVPAMVLTAVGCDVINPQPVMSEPTAHVMTLYAVLTESAMINSMPTATPTLPPTEIPPSPTESPRPTDTLLPELPSVTPAPTNFPIPCYRIGKLTDVTIPDNYDELDPGEVFVKTWRLTNSGSCNWSASVQLVFVSGAQMNGPNSQTIDATVGVGQYIDISVTLKAPTTAGKHTGYWMLKGPDGTVFGLGSNGTESFWVMIQMSNVTVTPSLTKTPSTPVPTKTPTITPTLTPTRTPTNTITPTCDVAYPPPGGC